LTGLRMELTIRPNPLATAGLLCLGAACLALAALFPFLLDSPLPGFLLVGLPLLFGGAVCVAHAWALMGLRLYMDEKGLRLTAPCWRGFPSPPLTRIEAAWKDILAVQRRTERYYLGPVGTVDAPTLLVTKVYSLNTASGRVILGEKNLPALEQHMAAIAERAGVALQELPMAHIGVFQALRQAGPAWDEPRR